MARPRLNSATSRASYSDVVPLWEKAIQLNGLEVTCPDEATAIAKVFRLNSWRVKQRGTGDFSMDRFVVRRKGQVILLDMRKDGLEELVVKTLEGDEVKVISDAAKPPSGEESRIIMEGINGNKDDFEITQAVNDWRIRRGLPPRDISDLFPKKVML